MKKPLRYMLSVMLMLALMLSMGTAAFADRRTASCLSNTSPTASGFLMRRELTGTNSAMTTSR